jgi:hypothetical protein
MLSQEASAEFKKLYLEEFGVELADDETVNLAVSLLAIFNCTYRPVKKEWLDDLAAMTETIN